MVYPIPLWLDCGMGEDHVHLTGDQGQTHAGQPLGEIATGRDTGHCVWTEGCPLNACLSGNQSHKYQLLTLVGSEPHLLSKFTHLSIRFPFPTCQAPNFLSSQLPFIAPSPPILPLLPCTSFA